ncbi:MAG: hypothetical protein KAQ64_00065 [Candidatus Pacebacteria bacterium]|nr:hypothetical protein [Candidatus Paceibacterota bacterium]
MKAVITEMNTEIRRRIPGLNVDVYEFHNDEQAYGIMFFSERLNDLVSGTEILEEINQDFAEKISRSVEFKNPFANIGRRAVSLAIWVTPDVFLVDNEDPWTIKNHTKSPIYIDGGALTSWADIMNLMSAFAQVEIQRAMEEFDILIGGETRGIAIATWIANDLFKGVGVARKVVKEYGTGQGIEGKIRPGEVCILVEDLITDGGSKGVFIQNIRNAGAIINDVIVIFDRKQGGEQYLAERWDVRLHSLTDIDTHLEVGVEYGYITEEEAESIKKYLEDPKEWNLKRKYGWPITG